MANKKLVYSTKNNIQYIMKVITKINKCYFLYFILYLLLLTLIPFCITLIPGYIISMLEKDEGISAILITISILLIGVGISNYIFQIVRKRIMWINTVVISGELRYQFYHKLLSCDYSLLQNQEVRNDISASNFFLSPQIRADKQVYSMIAINLLANILGFLLYSIVVSTLQVWILILLFCITLINFKMQMKAKQYELNHMDKFWANNDQHWYLRKECEDVKKGKDIRLYQIQNWFNVRYEKNTNEANTIYSDVQNKTAMANIGIRITSLLRDVIVYGYLIYLLMNGQLSISLFVIYVGIVYGFSAWLIEIVSNFTLLRHSDILFDKYRRFLDLQDWSNNKTSIELCKQAHDITFENVSFSYADNKYIFKNFNLNIKAKEKVALVGVNGAGKTTLMKLLCNLYALESGVIKIDGHSLMDMSREDVFKEIAIVFQEINEIALSIASFVSCCIPNKENLIDENSDIDALLVNYIPIESDLQFDEKRVIDVLKKAGLWDKVQQLPSGIYTNLTKHFDKDGIQFSGGEMQKLMLARALYKDANILILDEPTAALDPIAESEMYEKYATLCEDKTSIFISHRLSSTKFCDRILFLEDGQIVEEGTHEQLMKKNGKYAQMFAIQSYYYQEEYQNECVD